MQGLRTKSYPLTFATSLVCSVTVCAVFVAEIFQIIGKQTNGSELNANRVEMKTAQHFSSIRQTNIGTSLEKRGKDISRWLLRTPAAG